jgi:ribosomal protein S18 acetylase RimI-like enzyme
VAIVGALFETKVLVTPTRAQKGNFMTSVIRIRTRFATIEDVEIVAVLFDAYRQFYEHEADLNLARRFIADRIRNDESVVLLALTSSAQAVGFCQLYPTFCSLEARPIYALYDLFVTPNARRMGVGTILLQAAEEQARENGKVRMDLTTAKSNKPAQNAYEALGWVRDDVFFAYSRAVAGKSVAT